MTGCNPAFTSILIQTMKNQLFTILVLISITLFAQWRLDQLRPEVLEYYNDRGNWGGVNGLDMLPIGNESVVAKKIIPLDSIPQELLKSASSASLMVHIGILDYSIENRTNPQSNGLNEQFEIAVNDHVLTFSTADTRFPARAKGIHKINTWVEIPIPTDLVKADSLTVQITKLKTDNPDDYIYPSVDRTVANTHSHVSRDGGNSWTQDWNRRYGNEHCGEFLIRLRLATFKEQGLARWTPASNTLHDPERILAYCGREQDENRIELRNGRWNDAFPLTLVLETQNPQKLEVQVLDSSGKPIDVKPDTSRNNALAFQFQPGQAPSVIIAKGAILDNVNAEFVQVSEPVPKDVTFNPVVIAQPKGKRRQDSTPIVAFTPDKATLQNQAIKAVFQLKPVLKLTQLHCAEIDRDIIEDKDASKLFRLKFDDGDIFEPQNGVLRSATPIANGFEAVVRHPKRQVQCVFRATLDDDELRLALDVINLGAKTETFALAFPHLAGLQLSADPADDGYVFPYGGGIAAAVNCHLRAAYGDNDAWWQMVDLFSCTQGGGLYLRSDDPKAIYKTFNLRKGIRQNPQFVKTRHYLHPGRAEPATQWRDSLDPNDGIAVAIDYVQRTRTPGGSFSPPDAILGTHGGSWHNAMKRYFNWAKNAWGTRPFPSKLTEGWNFRAGVGVEKNQLFHQKEKRYRTEIFGKENHTRPGDIWEIYGWWNHGETAPWNVPFENDNPNRKKWVDEWFDETANKQIRTFCLGDFDGYNPKWGGLKAFRDFIEFGKSKGHAVILYTDFVIIDPSTKASKKLVPDYAVINHRYKLPPKHANSGNPIPTTPPGIITNYSTHYQLCIDNETMVEHIVENVQRIIRETDADGVRLDEFGARGFFCHNPRHNHLFTEQGHTEWMQATAHIARKVHERIDTIAPGKLLLAEFPGFDKLAATLEAALCYDLKNRQGPLRPAHVNLLRFYMPSCKIFEIDDRASEQNRINWKLCFWNAVGIYNSGVYPDEIRNILLEHNDAFALGFAEPLVPTGIPGIYANKFTAKGKTIWTLLNASGHTINGEILKGLDANAKHIELIGNKPFAPVNGAYIDLLRNGDVRAILQTK